MIARYARSRRASELKCSMPASVSARPAAASRRPISTLSAACGFSFPMRSRFSKVMGVADEEDFLVREHALKERITGRHLRSELAYRVKIGVDFPAQGFLRRCKRVNDLRELGLAEYHRSEE